jgi:phage tail protein X
MTQRTETVRSEGLTLPRLVWRLLRKQPRGYVEKVLDLNPGLADLGPELPVGTVVKLPLDEVTPAAQPKAIRMWD